LLERRHDSAGYELDEAETVVCVGVAVGGPTAVQEIGALAERLGGALGGDRHVCEAGWLARNRQIGLFGRAVAPRLYVAVGVDGDDEHLAGPMKAGVVVALDADARSPMLAEADVAVVGDWRETLPALVDALAAG
jgi:electron transfer flavoprotein alpha subunit